MVEIWIDYYGRGYFAGLRVTKRNKATVLLMLTLFQTPTLTVILTLTLPYSKFVSKGPTI